MVYTPRDNHQYLIILPQNHTLLLLTKHALGHNKLSRDKLFLVAPVSLIRSFHRHMASHSINGDKSIKVYIISML